MDGDQLTGGSGEVELLLDVRKEARRSLEQSVADHPTFADLENRLGMLELLDGRPEAADERFRRAVRLNPGYLAASANLRVAAICAGRDSEPGSSEPSDIGSESWAQARLKDAWVLERSGNIQAALDICAELQETASFRSAGWIYAAKSLAQAERWQESADALHQAADAAPGVREILRRWALPPFDSGDAQSALASLSDLAFWLPTFAELYIEFGGICARNGLIDQARDEYFRSVLVWPVESEFHLRMADLASAQDREEETLDHLSRAIDCEPTNVRGRIALGFEYASQGLVEEAIVQFEVAAKLEPAFADVRYNLGSLYLHQGRLEEGVRHLEAAIELNPRYVPARSTLAFAKKKLGHMKEALALYRELMSMGTKSPDVLAHAAEAYLEEGETDLARELLEQACRDWPNYPRAYHLLGRLYRLKGLRRKAQWAWKRFLETSGEWEPMERDLTSPA